MRYFDVSISWNPELAEAEDLIDHLLRERAHAVDVGGSLLLERVDARFVAPTPARPGRSPARWRCHWPLAAVRPAAQQHTIAAVIRNIWFCRHRRSTRACTRLCRGLR